MSAGNGNGNGADLALRVLTLNLAHGRGTGFHQALTSAARIEANLDQVAELIEELQPDVVALQELDAPSSWSGGFDHLEYLGRRTGFDHGYHGLHVERRRPTLRYGTGILSQFPLLRGNSRRFGLNPLDTKGFVLVTVETPLGRVDVASVHLDFKRRAERHAQLGMLGGHLDSRPDPSPHLVVAGDFNTNHERPAMATFNEVHALRVAERTAGTWGTFPSRRPRRRIDYVLASGELLFTERRAIPAQVSDHLPVLVELGVR